MIIHQISEKSTAKYGESEKIHSRKWGGGGTDLRGNKPMENGTISGMSKS
jgi:hypothetical protein